MSDSDGPLGGLTRAGEIWTVSVAAGDGTYPVVIGPHVRDGLATHVRRTGAARAVFVTSRPHHWLPDPGVPSTIVDFADGERHKDLGQVAELCSRFAQAGLTSHDIVISCGGGTTTDMVGLAAALYHRGTRVVHLPSTLLAQADASVGGKTAANLPEGKNLVGTFWQPAAVLCDSDFLVALPPAERLNGYGEIARAQFIGAGELRGLPVHEQIARCVALKAAVVATDERDSGRRHVLNYGHTLGHALEIASGFTVSHGRGVAIGTVFAGLLARTLGRIDDGRVAEHLDVVRFYGLPVAPPPAVDDDTLVTLMRRDKKVDGPGLAFVLDGPAGVELVPGVAVADVLGTLAIARRAV